MARAARNSWRISIAPPAPPRGNGSQPAPGAATATTSTAENKAAARRNCEEWELHPWNEFLSLKFTPGSSQAIDGFVFGVSYAVQRYLQVLVGHALTPINQPAPGFQITASQFVEKEHLAGRALAYDPTAMKNNAQYAFDGFPVTDSTAKLIYQGSPLSVLYHGGVLFGVSFPFYFKSALQPKS
jgi:hypothetical protein